MSQAPGLSGTPAPGHVSRAAISASWARSSARPTSRTSRATPPTMRPDSMRQTASILRATSRAIGVLLADLPAQLLFLLAQFWRQTVAEVFHPEDRTDLDLRLRTHRVRAAPHPFDCLIHRTDLPDPEARHQFLGLCEWAVDHRAVFTR